MQNQNQNAQIETACTLARQGGHYKWSAVPISDASSTAEDPVFRVIHPQESFRREALAAAQRRDDLLLVEGARAPHLSAESWEANAPRNALVGERIVALLDRLSKKRKNKKLDERDRHVASDRRRQSAFDLAMPLSNEVLHSWNAYLRKRIDAYGPAAHWFKALDGFLDRINAGRRYHELTWDEKALLGQILEKIVEAA
jgi:hypothetical protein